MYDAAIRRRRTITTGYPSCPSRMSPSRSRERERPCGPLRPATCANRSSSSSLRTTSSGSSPPLMNGGSTLQLKPVEKDFSTKGGCGSPTISRSGTLPSCSSTHKTLPSRQADRALRKDSSPDSVPLSPNYFDVLSEEQDAPPERSPRRERESPSPQGAPTLSRNPREKAPMSLQDQEMEREEADLQQALHLSRVEAQKHRTAGTHRGHQKEATDGIMSSTARSTTTLASGSTTRKSPLCRTPLTSSRIRSPTDLPPHLKRNII